MLPGWVSGTEVRRSCRSRSRPRAQPFRTLSAALYPAESVGGLLTVERGAGEAHDRVYGLLLFFGEARRASLPFCISADFLIGRLAPREAVVRHVRRAQRRLRTKEPCIESGFKTRKTDCSDNSSAVSEPVFAHQSNHRPFAVIGFHSRPAPSGSRNDTVIER